MIRRKLLHPLLETFAQGEHRHQRFVTKLRVIIQHVSFRPSLLKQPQDEVYREPSPANPCGSRYRVDASLEMLINVHSRLPPLAGYALDST